MGLTILESKAAIQAAIATMHPIAQEAAQLLAHRIFETPSLLNDTKRLGEEWVQSCAISTRRAGVHDEESFAQFLENHGQAVLNVAVSIVLFTIRSSERRRKWGWIGRAAALAGAAAVGAFFGG